MIVDIKPAITCPLCGTHLWNVKDHSGEDVFACPVCEGRTASIKFLKQFGAPDKILSLIQDACKKSPRLFAKRCPHCGDKMRPCLLPLNGLELDVCGYCGRIWFDPREYDKLPLQWENIGLKKKKWPKNSIVNDAFTEMKKDKLVQDSIGEFCPPEYWQWIPACLSLPVEIEKPPPKNLPWTSWSLAFVLLSFFVWNYFEGGRLTGEWGFLSGQWQRHGGLTIVTSFFAQGFFVLLAPLLYLLVVFGARAEDYMGKIMFGLVLISSHMAGLAVYFVFNRIANMPFAGAGCGMAGVLACYSILCPQTMAGFFPPLIFAQWIKTSILNIIIGYFLLLLFFGILLLSLGEGSTVFFCHMAAIVTGFSIGMLVLFKKPNFLCD